MDSYPAELIVQLQPFILVTGIIGDKEGTPRNTLLQKLSQPFEKYPDLSRSLADTFTKYGKTKVWSPPQEAPNFHFALSGPGYRYPPAKSRANIRNVSDLGRRALSSLPPRSHLSPLQVGSPLFPDGILSPAWIRKHLEYIPSVQIVFYVLPDASVSEDAALIEAMTEMRTQNRIRGIRHVAVLLANRADLSRSESDTRISHIRKMAGLDERASFFVLPTETSDLGAFVLVLQRSLYEPALEYYRERARHVRRNRARYPPPPSITQPILAAASAAGVLRPGPVNILGSVGWTVRTATKLGVFAEIQYELSEALSQYGEAYECLMHACLANTKVLAPRTKRWAEAKVLADTLSVKLIKLHLYRQAVPQAMNQYQRHIRHIAELSTGWGISTSTYEFWSWLTKQFQILGDLILHATRPSEPSERLSSSLLSGVSNGIFGAFMAQPGTHFYHAALCTLERAERFRVSQDGDDLPNYAKEAQIDHIALSVDLFTTAYEAYKQNNQNRHMYLMAARIAMTYFSAARYSEALPYLDRALRWYRRSRWTVPRFLLVTYAAQSAIAQGNERAAVMYLLELMQTVPDEVLSLQQDVLTSSRKLLTTNRTQSGSKRDLSMNSSSDPASEQTNEDLSMSPGSANMLLVSAVFARHRVLEMTHVDFQLVLRRMSFPVALETLRVFIEGHAEPFLTIQFASHDPTHESESRKAAMIDVGSIDLKSSTEISVTLETDHLAIISGAFKGHAGHYLLSHAFLTVRTSVGQVEVPLRIQPGLHWLLQGRNGCQILTLPPSERRNEVIVDVAAPTLEMSHPEKMYSGEIHAIDVKIGDTLDHGILVLSNDTVLAGAGLASNAEILERSDSPSVDRLEVNTKISTVFLRAPQSPGSLYVRLYGMASKEPESAPISHVDYCIQVENAFEVRVHLSWIPSLVPRCGHLTTEIDYTGDNPILFEDAHVQTSASHCVQPSIPLGSEEQTIWDNGNRSVLVFPLAEQLGGTNEDASLNLVWRRDKTCATSCTRFSLASIAPPLPNPIDVVIRAPGSTKLESPSTMQITLSNSTMMPVDLLLEIDQDDLFLLAGWRRHKVSMLLPNEQRQIHLTLIPRFVGLHTIPKVRAFEMRTDMDAIPINTPAPGVMNVE
ncbi:hypothetical protein MYAM1_000307 [Malassezia yamatoensis]|uniref:Trafficking protein particle complex subunit 11 domain-containing protein n=1 Tax=Malassezia yamatoensis TaxID=253288 RepID=A0AAJ5YPV5_9BASI|nr:hypothetical protein MYAM1_000307 [Malassezia yamatoensis]